MQKGYTERQITCSKCGDSRGTLVKVGKDNYHHQREQDYTEEEEATKRTAQIRKE